jgi:hypothetical protein
MSIFYHIVRDLSTLDRAFLHDLNQERALLHTISHHVLLCRRPQAPKSAPSTDEALERLNDSRYCDTTYMWLLFLPPPIVLIFFIIIVVPFLIQWVIHLEGIETDDLQLLSTLAAGDHTTYPWLVHNHYGITTGTIRLRHFLPPIQIDISAHLTAGGSRAV